MKSIKQPVRKGAAKVPMIMQLEALECGAACLAMVLAYYGRWMPLEQVRADCGISRDGSNAANVLNAARRYGLDAKGYRFEPEDLRREGKFPCIIHWNFNHFVVLNGFQGGNAIINDPGRGLIKVPMNVFDKSFTGVCIMFEPGENFEQGGKPKSVLTFAGSRLRGSAPMFAFIILTTVIASVIGLIQPALGRIFVDVLLPGNNPGWLLPFCGIMLGIAALRLVVAALEAMYMLKLEAKFAIVANAAFFWHILRLPLSFYSQRMAGDIAERQASNEGIAAGVVKQVTPLFLQTVMLALYLAVMLRYSLILTLVGLIGLLLNMFTAGYVSRKRIGIAAARSRSAALMASMQFSGIEMMETIKASGAENGYFEKWSGYQAAVNTNDEQEKRLLLHIGSIPALVSHIVNHTILITGIFLIINGEFTAGMLLAFQGYLAQFSAPANRFINVGRVITQMRTDMERVEDVMLYKPDVEYGDRGQADNTYKEPLINCLRWMKRKAHGAQKPRHIKRIVEVASTAQRSDSPAQAINQRFQRFPGGVSRVAAAGAQPAEYDKLSGRIEMNNVTFGYSPLGEPLLRDFSISVQPGQRIALVGASGCGKSTVSKLLSGMYQPWNGEILYDGKPFSEIDHAVFTASLAVVDQDIILFGDTISNNIKMWDNSIEDFEMIMAARDAGLHEEIVRRDGGYQYKMAEGGSDFSGGQRQRLEIARALAGDPTLIILDEATNALDAKTEFETVKHIKDRGITCVIIAHRLSTIRDCDVILVMDNGQIVERGTHNELLDKNGLYCRLVSYE